MRALICNDDGQLRRVERAIAAIESAQPYYRQSKQALLEALHIERASQLQYTKRYRGRSDRVTAPVWVPMTRLGTTPAHGQAANA